MNIAQSLDGKITCYCTPKYWAVTLQIGTERRGRLTMEVLLLGRFPRTQGRTVARKQDLTDYDDFERDCAVLMFTRAVRRYSNLDRGAKKWLGDIALAGQYRPRLVNETR